MEAVKKSKKNPKAMDFMDGMKEYFKDRSREKVRALEGFEANIQHDMVYLDNLKDKAQALHFKLNKIAEIGKQKNDVEFTTLDIDLFKTAEEISKVEQIVYDKYVYFTQNLKPRMEEEFKESEKGFDKMDKEAKAILKEYSKVEKELGENPLIEKIKKVYTNAEDLKFDLTNKEDKNHTYKELKRLVSVWKSDATKGKGKK